MTCRAFLRAALLTSCALTLSLPPAGASPAETQTLAVRQQFNPNFTVLNRSGATILTIQIARDAPVEGAPDLLGRNVLRHGERFDVRPEASANERPCFYDIRLTWTENRVQVLRGQNVCAIDVLIVAAPAVAAAPGTIEVIDHSPVADVYIRNNGTSPIVEIGASPPRESAYVLRGLPAPISVGGRFLLAFPRDGECIYDLLIRFADGRIEELPARDLCAVSEVAFPHADSSVSTARAN